MWGERPMLTRTENSDCLIYQPLDSSGNDPLPIDAAAEWYAVQTRSRHEKRVAAEARARAMEEFLPLHRCRSRWKNGITADVDHPLFPCYLFVKVPRCERLRLLQVPGVIGLAVNSSRPTALSPENVEAIKALSLICHAEPHPFLKRGDRVRIVAGPLAGKEGILVRRAHDLRVVLSLDFILRSVAVEVSEFDIEPIRGRTMSSMATATGYSSR
jgi:transcription antitermination factor NusG